jgi:hypothetical protein
MTVNGRSPLITASTIILLLALLPSPAVLAQDYSNLLNKKRLIMVGSRCAGLEFINKKAAVLYADLDCQPSPAWGVQWLAPKIFVLTEKERTNQECPPRNFIYIVESFKKNRILLREPWTGWGDFKESKLQYRIESNQ